MRCYVQEIQVKSSNSIGCGKELYVTTSNWTVNGIKYTSYGYTYSDDKFERPIKTAYKVTIHGKSYRDDKGKVRKKQYHLTTIKYYDLIDYCWYDCIVSSKIKDIAEKMGVAPDLVWDEITKKLDALQDKVIAEFEKTEEYKTNKSHEAVLDKYRKNKADFAQKYEIEENEYDRCYDIFGVLRNQEYLEKIKREYDSRKRYEKRSSSYQENYQSNYNNYSNSYGSSALSNNRFSQKEKEYFKKFYKTLAAKYHPDVSGDNEAMQLVNKLKKSWGI